MMQVYVSNLQGARNDRTEQLIIEQTNYEKLVIEQDPNLRRIGIQRSTFRYGIFLYFCTPNFVL